MRKRISLALVLAFGLSVGLFLGSLLRTPDSIAAACAAGEVDQGEMAELRDFAAKFGKLFRMAAEEVSPAVVYISSEKTIRVQPQSSPFDDPRFDQFFGPQFRDFFGHRGRTQPREYKQRGLGTGVILDEDGYILTNNHVVAGADKLTVKLASGEVYNAKAAGTDPKTDLAVVKIDEKVKDLPTARLGDSDKISVGDWVIAVGNPFGFANTVSSGIVSAKGRILGMTAYENLIQTDAAINPGNSGGPLVNLSGEVIGINNAIFSRSGGNQGIGFAIPINMAKPILADLKAGKMVERGYLGVHGENLTPELAEQFGYKGEGGALVTDVVPDTPAGRVELAAGDIILEWDGKKVDDFADLRELVAATRSGEKVKVTLWRGTGEKTVTVTVGRLADFEGLTDAGWLGLKVGPLTDEIREQLGKSNLQGVVITDVVADSPAGKEGLEVNDVILSVDRRQVKSKKDFARRVAARKGDKVILLHLIDHRTGRPGFVIVRGE